TLGFFGAHPGWPSIAFVWAAHFADLHQEGFDYEFLHSSGLPEHTFGMEIDVEVARLDEADGSSFFLGLTLGGLAVRKVGLGTSLGEGPLVAAIGINHKELNGRAAPAITDRSHLKWQSLRGAG